MSSFGLGPTPPSSASLEQPNWIKGYTLSLRLFSVTGFPRASMQHHQTSAESRPRKVVRGVLRGTVISPLAMTALDAAMTFRSLHPVRTATYADDTLWCVGRSTQARAIQMRIQESLTVMYSHLKNVGLSVSIEKTSFTIFRHRASRSLSHLPLFLGGKRANLVRKHPYLDLVIYDRIALCSAVTEVIVTD